MTTEKLDKHEHTYLSEDRVATQKDLRILSLELEQKILQLKIEIEQKILEMKVELKLEIEQKVSSVVYKLGGLIIATSGILFALLSYFHK